MKIEKKTVATILVFTAALSLFVGFTSATTPGNDPISQILATLTSINNQLGAINEKLDSANATQILSYYENHYGWYYPNSTEVWISTDKPAKFIVTLGISGIAGEDDVLLWVMMNKFLRMGVQRFDAAGGDHQYAAITTAGLGVHLSILNSGTGWLLVSWTVMVEGTPGTVVTIEDPHT